MDMNKKAFVFTFDAVLATIVFVLVIGAATQLIVIESVGSSQLDNEQLHYIASDSMQVISETGVLDEIGTMWSDGNCTSPTQNENCSAAAQLANESLGRIMPDGVGYRIRFANDPIFTDSQGVDEDKASSTSVVYRIASGFEVGKPIQGFLARAYLSKINSKTTSKYVYFGGFEGSGNLTKLLFLPDNISSIDQVSMELDAGNSFSLYFNGTFAGNYTPTAAGNLTPDSWTVPPQYCGNLTSGGNEIELKFAGSNISDSFIGGGYLKVQFTTSELDTSPLLETEKQYLPGVSGAINIFSSFFVPGDLESMKIHLHYISNYTTFMTIGDIQVFNGSSEIETVKIINNTVLSGLLNYTKLGQKTVPFRLGVASAFLEGGGKGEGDIVEVTDVSGSMEGTKLSAAKNASKLMAGIILNGTGNRVGLVSYESSTDSTHDLSSNLGSLESEIDGYTADGGTCICCGISSSVNMLNTQSNASRTKAMVVMSDGEANQECTHNYCDWVCIWIWCWWDCPSSAAKQDAIDFACDAYENYNITVHAVGFGDDADEETLQGIADCGNGSYYFADVDELAEVYEQIAQEFVNISFTEQKVYVTGNITNSILYPDSYIEYNFDRPNATIKFREVSQTIESPMLKDSFGYLQTQDFVEGSFDAPIGGRITDAKITSYSSQYWTDNASIENLTTSNWNSIYELSDYGSDYTGLGDPYIVQIPRHLVEESQRNFIRIGTGLNPTNGTGGSPYSRVIFTYKFSASVGYGNVFPTSEDAVSDAINRLNQTLAERNITYEIAGINVSSKGASKIPSLWGPARFVLEVWR